MTTNVYFIDYLENIKIMLQQKQPDLYEVFTISRPAIVSVEKEPNASIARADSTAAKSEHHDKGMSALVQITKLINADTALKNDNRLWDFNDVA